MQLLILIAITIALVWTSSGESDLPLTLKWKESNTYYRGDLFERGQSFWYECPEGMVVSGFISNHNTGCTAIYCLDGLECVKPEIPETAEIPNDIELHKQECYDLIKKFDGKFGNMYDETYKQYLQRVECDAGYFVRGLLSNAANPLNSPLSPLGLEQIEGLRCCKYDEDIIAYDPVTTKVPYKDCLNPAKYVADHKCNVGQTEFITGFVRQPFVRSPFKLNPFQALTWHMVHNGVTSLSYAMVNSLNLKQVTGCKVTGYKLQDEAGFRVLHISADNIESIKYINSRTEEYEVATISKQICKTKENIFEYKSGLEKTYGFDVSYSTSIGGNILDMLKTETTIAASFNMQWTEKQEFTTTERKEEKVCTTKPTEKYQCPARTICERKFVSITSGNGQYPIELTTECDDGKQYKTNGVISSTGYQAIYVTDSQLPLDCKHYTDDYYSRGDGKLFACDTCDEDADKTNICDVCRDGYIELYGQCITAATCNRNCGGEVKGSGINPDGIGSNDIPWSGAYCDIIDDNKFNSKQCQDELQ